MKSGQSCQSQIFPLLTFNFRTLCVSCMVNGGSRSCPHSWGMTDTSYCSSSTTHTHNACTLPCISSFPFLPPYNIGLNLLHIFAISSASNGLISSTVFKKATVERYTTQTARCWQCRQFLSAFTFTSGRSLCISIFTSVVYIHYFV